MQNKHHRKNLHRLVQPGVKIEDVVHSHAYGKVARDRGGIVPPVRPISPSKHHTIPGYRDSMVGSIAQYRDKMPERPKAPEAGASSSSDVPIVGNRPQNGATEKGKIGSDSIERRHHFIEPPKRGFNRFG